MTEQTQYEVIVVGGGLTGVMMALALSYGGFGSAAEPAIALVDRANAIISPVSPPPTTITS